MSIPRLLGGLALASTLILGACGGSDSRSSARGTQGTPSGSTMQNPLNAGTPAVGNPDRIGGPGSANASAVPGSAAGGGTGTRNQGYGAPVR